MVNPISGRCVAVTVAEEVTAASEVPLRRLAFNVAVLGIEPALRSAAVTARVAVQVISAPPLRADAGQVIADNPLRGSVTTMEFSDVLPVFFTRKL